MTETLSVELVNIGLLAVVGSWTSIAFINSLACHPHVPQTAGKPITTTTMQTYEHSTAGSCGQFWSRLEYMCKWSVHVTI